MEITNFTGSIDFISADSVQGPQNLLLEATKILDSGYIDYWLAFGTLLGFYRDGDIIPEDTDIDLSILIKDENDIPQIVKAFSKKYKYIRSVVKDGEQMQSAFQRPDNFIIDLSFFREDGDDIYSYCEGGLWKNKLSTVMPLGKLDTKYGKFNVPKNIEEYLTSRYQNWKEKSDDKSINNI